MTTVDAGEPTATHPSQTALASHTVLTDAPMTSEIWEEPMPSRPVPAKLGRLTLALLVLVVGAGAYYLGVVTEKHSLPATTTTSSRSARTAATSTAATPTGAAQSGAAGGGGGGPTIGAVKLIDGANIYVTDQTGNVVKVATTPDSQITITSTGTAKDVKPGDAVLVTGPTGDDGTITATAVRDQGPGGTGFGGRGPRGGSPGTGSGAPARGTGATPGG